jgi:glycyl-tRNA synthetase beta chain
VPTADVLRESDGKAEALFLRQLAPGAGRWPRPAARARRGDREAADPQGDEYQLADGWTTSVHFVRPAHGLVALHGARGAGAGARPAGGQRHARPPLRGGVTELTMRDADSYAAQLADQGAVIAGFAERRAEIVRQLHCRRGEGRPDADRGRRAARRGDRAGRAAQRAACQFEREFLDVPQECLILTMKANQKYFPLLDARGRLTNKFLIVSNIRPADPSAVIEGNERVVRPRLADAKFFFDQDRKSPLASRVARLANVVYHAKLGTQGERVERVRAHRARYRASAGRRRGARRPRRALAKADLLTDMVGEFPELQGIMGGYYARHDGEPSRGGQAIEEHYKPRFAGDALPRGQVGTGGAGRQAGDAGRPVRHRPAADRRQGPVRAAPPRAGRDAHADRARACRARGQHPEEERGAPPAPSTRAAGRAGRAALHAALAEVAPAADAAFDAATTPRAAGWRR